MYNIYKGNSYVHCVLQLQWYGQWQSCSQLHYLFLLLNPDYFKVFIFHIVYTKTQDHNTVSVLPMKTISTHCLDLGPCKWIGRSVRKALRSTFSYVNNRFLILMFQTTPPMTQFPTTDAVSHCKSIWINLTCVSYSHSPLNKLFLCIFYITNYLH